MLLWCSFWLVRVGPSECGARVREGMDLISCCMSTLDDRRAVDESGGGGRGNGAQRGGGQSHAAWSNLSRGRTMFRFAFEVCPDLSRGFRLAELRFVREPFARCDPSESGGNERETPRSRARSRGPERPQSQRCRALARWPRASRMTSSPSGSRPLRQRVSQRGALQMPVLSLSSELSLPAPVTREDQPVTTLYYLIPRSHLARSALTQNARL